MDNKYIEKAEIIEVYYLVILETEPVVKIKIKDKIINCFNPNNITLEVGKTYNIYLTLLTTNIMKKVEMTKYMETNYEGDCLANGEIVKIYIDDADKISTESVAIIDCGIYVEIEIPRYSFKIGDYIAIEGRLDIENAWKDSYYGSSPISNRF